jgi:hypothetical protein
VLAIMLVLGLLASHERTVAGSFWHGQWEGECFRDGTLRGMNDEICRARWSGDMDVSFDRDADKLILYVATKPDTGAQCSDLVEIPAHRLAGDSRVTLLANAIRAARRRISADCRVPGRSTVISLRDLRAVLRETDGLIHIP